MRYGRHGQRAALTLYTFFHGNRTVRRPARARRDPRPRSRWAQGGPVVGSTSAGATTDVGGRTFGEKREKSTQRRAGGQGEETGLKTR